MPAAVAAKRPSVATTDPHAQEQVAPPSRRSSAGLRRQRAPAIDGKLAVVLLFLPPALFLFTLFVALPMGEAAWYSFYNWNGYGAPTQFVGLTNFELLFAEPRVSHRAHQQPADHRRLARRCSCPSRSAMAMLLADRMRGT